MYISYISSFVVLYVQSHFNLTINRLSHIKLHICVMIFTLVFVKTQGHLIMCEIDSRSVDGFHPTVWYIYLYLYLLGPPHEDSSPKPKVQLLLDF